jgi:hypothetical protein
MTKNLKLLILAMISVWPFGIVFAQQQTLKKYIIITFEDKYESSGEGISSYYWIIPQDSILSNNNNVSRLFLSHFSKNNLIDCCNGKDINPLLMPPGTNFEFDSNYDKILDELAQIIVKNRKKIQTTTKIWAYGQKEQITIFATPVLGKFCSSNFDKFGQVDYGYKGKVYLPYSSFSYLGEFWQSEKMKFVLHEDFADVKFKIIPN